LQYLNTLPVSAGDLLLLRTRHPAMVSQALAHILAGSGFRALAAALVLLLMFSVAWVVVGAVGRATSLKALLLLNRSDTSFRLGPLLGLNVLRAAIAWSSGIGLMGAVLLAGKVSTKDDPSPGSAVLVFLLLALLLGFCWFVLNWFFSLSAVCAARENTGTFESLGRTIDLFRAEIGSIVAVGIWFGLAHWIVFAIAGTAIGFPLALVNLLPGGLVLGGVILVALGYFAAVDYLYAGRLAAYVYIAQNPQTENGAVLQKGDWGREGIDRSELILSDLPLGDASV
jgi:hypothetical protein